MILLALVGDTAPLLPLRRRIFFTGLLLLDLDQLLQHLVGALVFSRRRTARERARGKASRAGKHASTRNEVPHGPKLSKASDER